MSKVWETKEYLELEKEWNEILKKEGQTLGESLLNRKTDSVRKGEFEIDDAYVVYLRACTELLHSGKITNKLDLFILEKHCEGLSTFEIYKKLRTGPLVKKYRLKLVRQSVDYRLNKILKKHGIKHLGFKN